MNTVEENIGKEILEGKMNRQSVYIKVDPIERDVRGEHPDKRLCELETGINLWIDENTPVYPIPDPTAIQPGEEVEGTTRLEPEWCGPYYYIGESLRGIVVEDMTGCLSVWFAIRRIPAKKSIRERAIEILDGAGFQATTVDEITRLLAGLLR